MMWDIAITSLGVGAFIWIVGNFIIKAFFKSAEKYSDYEKFAEWVADEIFDEEWENNKDSFAEIACRKLEKLGFVRQEGNEWIKESEE